MVSSLNEAAMQADVLEGERILIRQAQGKTKPLSDADHTAAAVPADDDAEDEEVEVEEEEEEEEEADAAELRGRRARPSQRNGGGKGGRQGGGGARASAASDVSPSSPSSAPRTPARVRGRRSSSSTGRSPSTSRTPSSSASSASRRAAAEAPSAEEGGFSRLWREVARTPTSSVKSIVRSFLALYEAAKGGERLRLHVEVANFLLEAAGSVGGLAASELRGVREESDVAELVGRYEEAELLVAGEAPLRRIKKLEGRLRDTLHLLYAELPIDALSNDDFFSAGLPSFVAAFSRSAVRAYRLAMSVAYEGMMAGLIDSAVELEKQRATAEAQLEAVQRKKGGKAQSAQFAQLRNSVASSASGLELLQGLLKLLFSTIFCHRYRDVDADIRAHQLAGLAQWMVAYPSYFLHDSFLKYLGWTLHDKAAVVRRASLGGLLRIYQQATVDMVHSLDTFTRRFVSRIEQMAEDVEGTVSSLAIELMTVLLRLGALKEEEATHIPTLVWDEDAAVRRATVLFIVADTFGEKGREGEEKDGGGAEAAVLRHQEDLVQLVHLFLHYCPLVTHSQQKSRSKGKKTRAVRAGEEEGASHSHAVPHLRHLLVHAGRLTELRDRDYQHAVDVMVDALLPHLPALHDWQAQVQLILTGEEAEGKKKGKGKQKRSGSGDLQGAGPITEEMRSALLHMLVAAARRVKAGGGAGVEKEKKSDKEGKERREAAAAGLSLFLIDQLPVLLSTFLSSSLSLPVCLQLLSCIDYAHFQLHRKHAAFTSLLAVMKKLMTTSVDWPVLRECGLGWKALVRDNESYQEEAVHVVEEMTAEWRDAIQRLWEGAQGGGGGVGEESSQEAGSAAVELLDDEEAALTLLALLKRVLALCRPLHLAELAYSSASLQHIFQALLAAVASRAPQGSLVEQELLLALLHLLYTDILWSFTTLDRQTPARAAVERLVVKRNDLVHLLHQLLERPGSFAVQDAAFEMVSDVFVLFSGRLQGGVLSDLALNRDRVAPLSAAFAEHFQQMMDGEQAEQRKEQQRQRLAMSGGRTADEDGTAMEVDDADGAEQRRLQSLLADLRVQALTAAGKVLCFDHSLPANGAAAGAVPLRHPMLTAYAFSHFISTDAETLTLLRATMHLMRDHSFNGLLQGQRHSLIHLYEHHAEVEQMKALATKFALLHAVQHPSFLPFLLPALRYAVQDPPSRLPFLDVVLPFIARCSRSDAVELHRQYQAMRSLVREAQGDREQRLMRAEERDSWAALDRMEEQLAKKMGKATSAANRPLRSIGEGEGEQDGQEEEEVVEPSLLLTPTAPQRRSVRSEDSARSGRSILSLGLSPVKEAADEEEDSGTGQRQQKRQSLQQKDTKAGRGKKRSRQQRGEEEEEEEKEQAVADGADEAAAEEAGNEADVAGDSAAREVHAMDDADEEEQQPQEEEEEEEKEQQGDEGEEEVEAAPLRLRPTARKAAKGAASRKPKAARGRGRTRRSG